MKVGPDEVEEERVVTLQHLVVCLFGEELVAQARTIQVLPAPLEHPFMAEMVARQKPQVLLRVVAAELAETAQLAELVAAENVE